MWFWEWRLFQGGGLAPTCDILPARSRGWIGSGVEGVILPPERQVAAASLCLLMTMTPELALLVGFLSGSASDGVALGARWEPDPNC